MAQRTVVDCDKCGKQDIQAVSLAMHTGWIEGGPEREKEYTHIDLCVSCATALCKELIGEISPDRRVILAGDYRARRPR